MPVEIVVENERICSMHIIVFVFQYDERDTNMYLNCLRMNMCLCNSNVATNSPNLIYRIA